MSNRLSDAYYVRYIDRGSIWLIRECDDGAEFIHQCDGISCRQQRIRGKIVYKKNGLNVKWMSSAHWSAPNCSGIEVRTIFHNGEAVQGARYVRVLLFGDRAKRYYEEIDKLLTDNADPALLDITYENLQKELEQSKEGISEEEALRYAVNEFNRLEPKFQLEYVDGYEACVLCESNIGRVWLLWENSD